MSILHRQRREPASWPTAALILGALWLFGCDDAVPGSETSSPSGSAGGSGGEASTAGPGGNTSGSGASGGSGGSGGNGGNAGGGGGAGGADVCEPDSKTSCYTGPSGTLGKGVCVAGMMTCAADGSGYGPCENQVTPSLETCDTPGDDDCDGETNEEGAGCDCLPGSSRSCYSGPPSTENVGPCHGGMQTCNPNGKGYGPCQGEAVPKPETCNTTADDDCDGKVNEDGAGCVCTPNEVVSCYTGPAGTLNVGVCVGGTRTCNATGTVLGPCIGEVTPTPETCLTPGDDNCNGQTNESGPGCSCAPNAVVACYSGPPSTEGKGLCHAGTQTCNAGGTGYGPCTGEVTPVPETCNSPADEDCDGQTNEEGAGCVCVPDSTVPCYSGPPNTAGVGACHEGQRTCNADGTALGACAGQVVPQVENCATASTDDNCDGIVACSGATLWSKSAAPTDFAEIWSMAVDAAGNLVIVGDFLGTINLGGGPLVSANYDLFVAKLDRAGNHLWSKRFGGPSQDSTTLSVAVDAGGNIAMTGTLDGTIDFGGQPLSSVPGDEGDVFVVKLDPNGNHVWSKRFGDAERQDGMGIAFNPGGDVIVTGALKGSASFGGATLSSNGGTDVFLAAFGPLGQHLWSNRFGDAEYQVPSAVRVDAAGGIVLGGSTYGTIYFGGGQPLTSAGGSDPFVAKFSANGAPVWSKIYGDASDQGLNDLSLDPNGNIVLTGSFEGSLAFGGPVLTNPSAETAVYLAKLKPNGDHIYSRQFASTGLKFIHSVASDATGSAVIVGDFQGSIDLGGGVLTNIGSNDSFIAKYDPAGVHVWSRAVGNSDPFDYFESRGGAATDAFGNIFFGGFKSGNPAFDIILMKLAP